MFHGMGDDLAAAETLQELISLFEKRSSGRAPPEKFREGTASYRARMHFYFAEHHASHDAVYQWRVHLEQAVDADPIDPDVLIAMYRFRQQDDEWRQKTSELIQQAVGQFRRDIREYPDNPTPYNNFAWLVSNTVGDFDEALQASRKSLRLASGNKAGFLDTLARCYFAKGDVRNAIKYQTQAVRLEPFSDQIMRQLKYFKEQEQGHEVPMGRP